MEERLAETVFHGRHVVLGRTLRPLTFFHLFALQATGSAFCTEGGRLSFAELVQAVEICRRPRARLQRYLSRRRSCMDRLVGWLTVRIFARHYLGELAAFQAYLRDHFDRPDYFDADGTKCKVPWPLPQISRLIHHGHMTLDQAWDVNPGFAEWLIPALQEAAGHKINLISASEARILKEAGHAGIR